MGITIDVLDLGNVTIDQAFLVRGRQWGIPIAVPVYAFLLRGASANPILVDTGYRSPDVLTRIGLGAEVPEGHGLDAQLARHGLTPGDIGCVVMTHLHCDHAGRIHTFPMTTPVVVNRREMEFAASGAQGEFYAHEDVHHLLDRVYTPRALALLDLDYSGPVEIAPGVICERAGGHTPGLMLIRVETDEGVATICSDVIYNVPDQLVAPLQTIAAWEPQVSNNFTSSLLEEKGAIRRALQRTTFLLPSHSCGARVEHAQVTGLLRGTRVPGPHTPL